MIVLRAKSLRENGGPLRSHSWIPERALHVTPPDAIMDPGLPKRYRKEDAWGSTSMATFTHRQGQFLAFIHLYRLLHKRGPAETDMVTFFRVTPPSVHQMVVKLEGLGLITRESGVPRSARVAIPDEESPALEAVEEPPW